MANIDLRKKVIGIPLTTCFICGEKEDKTRHHVIPKALNPKKNVTIPLCKDHKDTLHPIVKQLYLPKNIRRRIGRAIKLSDNLSTCLSTLRESTRFHNKKNLKSSVISFNGDE